VSSSPVRGTAARNADVPVGRSPASDLSYPRGSSAIGPLRLRLPVAPLTPTAPTSFPPDEHRQNPLHPGSRQHRSAQGSRHCGELGSGPARAGGRPLESPHDQAGRSGFAGRPPHRNGQPEIRNLRRSPRPQIRIPAPVTPPGNAVVPDGPKSPFRRPRTTGAGHPHPEWRGSAGRDTRPACPPLPFRPPFPISSPDAPSFSLSPKNPLATLPVRCDAILVSKNLTAGRCNLPTVMFRSGAVIREGGGPVSFRTGFGGCRPRPSSCRGA
jgi:hypothetical protein